MSDHYWKNMVSEYCEETVRKREQVHDILVLSFIS